MPNLLDHNEQQAMIEHLECRRFLSAAVTGSAECPAVNWATDEVAPRTDWAPTSIRGAVAFGTINGGTDPFADAGTYQFRTAATGSAYVIIGGPGVANSQGAYIYRKLSATKAEIVLNDSLIGLVGTQTITFTSATTATYTIIGNGGYQRGTLKFSSPLVSGSISGYVFNDANRNGVKDSGEAGLPGRRVYIDNDGDRRLDVNEKSIKTSSTGWYKLSDLLPGSYTVREVLPTGWRLIRPTSGYYKVALTWGTVSKNKNFANIRTTSPLLAVASPAGSNPTESSQSHFSVNRIKPEDDESTLA